MAYGHAERTLATRDSGPNPHSASLRAKARLATEAVAIAANSATTTADGITVICGDELLKVMSLGRGSNRTARP